MKKIKLYFFHPYSRIGGADLSLSRLINNLDKNRFSITFITLEKPKINNYLNTKIEIKIIKKKKALFSIFDLRRIVQKNKQKFSKIIFISNQNFANIISVISLLFSEIFFWLENFLNLETSPSCACLKSSISGEFFLSLAIDGKIGFDFFGL